MLRAGVVVAMATGALVGSSAPAHAIPPSLSVSPDSVTIRAGSDATVTVKVTTKAPTDTDVTISLTGLPAGVTCSGGCAKVTVVPDQEKTHLLTLRAASTAPGANRIRVTVRAEAQSGSSTANLDVTVQPAPQVAPTVKEVSGLVADVTTGKGLAGAHVAMQDGANKQFDTQADAAGRFRFLPTAAKPISPGTLLINAGKDGYQTHDPISRQVAAGQSLTNLKLALRSAAAEATASALPTEATVSPTAEEASSEPANEAPAASNNEESGGGMLSWLLIGMGVLLVALGIGAIALLLLRRGDDEEDEDEEGARPARPGVRPPAPHPAAGVYHGGGPDPTMVARAGPMGDRTMMSRPPLADAPTAMHRPMADEFPDPYNPPRGPQVPYGSPAAYPTSPQPPGYGAPQPTYGGGPPGSPAPPPADPYGRGAEYRGPTSPAAPAGYAPTSGGGYRPTSGGGYGGYDQSSGYDDGYQQADPGYGQPGHGTSGNGYPRGYEPGGGYEPGQAGYSGAGRHGQGGYDAGGGYEQAGGGYEHGNGGYEQAGDYSAPGRHDQGGDDYGPPGRYDQGGGYAPDQRNGQQGYDGYYDEGSRHGAPPGRGKRRSIDWLDD